MNTIMALAKLEPSRPDELAAQVKEYRSVLGWSQQDLAQRAGCSRPTIARLEGGRVILSLTMTKVIDALNEGIADAVRNNQVQNVSQKAQSPTPEKDIGVVVKEKPEVIAESTEPTEPVKSANENAEFVPPHKAYGPVFSDGK